MMRDFSHHLKKKNLTGFNINPPALLHKRFMQCFLMTQCSGRYVSNIVINYITDYLPMPNKHKWLN